MDSNNATVIEERSRRRGADLSVPRCSPPQGVDLGLRATTIILSIVPPPRGWIHHGSCNSGDGD
jgi:hypothetical protein